jgi:hypothetical protein
VIAGKPLLDIRPLVDRKLRGACLLVELIDIAPQGRVEDAATLIDRNGVAGARTYAAQLLVVKLKAPVE